MLRSRAISDPSEAKRFTICLGLRTWRVCVTSAAARFLPLFGLSSESLSDERVLFLGLRSSDRKSSRDRQVDRPTGSRSIRVIQRPASRSSDRQVDLSESYRDRQVETREGSSLPPSLRLSLSLTLARSRFHSLSLFHPPSFPPSLPSLPPSPRSSVSLSYTRAGRLASFSTSSHPTTRWRGGGDSDII